MANLVVVTVIGSAILSTILCNGTSDIALIKKNLERFSSNTRYALFQIMEAQRNLQDYTEQRGSPRNLRQQLKDLKSVVGKQAKEIGSLQLVTGNQAKEIGSLKSKVRKLSAEKRKPEGAVYTRWGRSGCPKETELVYKGFTGGSWYTHPGGSVNYVCLPYDPTWGKYNDIQNNDNQNLHGVEYAGNSIDISGTPFDSRIRGHGVPCAVCRSTKRITVLRIPGRNKCYKGWHLEYAGYLMADKYSHTSGTEYACVDERPEITKSGPVSKGGRYFYPVEGYCGHALRCPPYVHGREITCCVCTK